MNKISKIKPNKMRGSRRQSKSRNCRPRLAIASNSKAIRN